jgi:hypothetical protein
VSAGAVLLTGKAFRLGVVRRGPADQDGIPAAFDRARPAPAT